MSTAEIDKPTFDQSNAEAFSERVAEMVDSGAVAVMLSVGHRTGLFDVMAAMAPATSDRIAERAALVERYVREWLAVMVTADIVTYDPAAATYHLPADRAACLTRDAVLGNFAVYGQFVAMMGAAQEQVLSRFETGGGTTYDDYPCFHQVMAEDSAQTVVASLFDAILPMADGLEARLEAGIDVLDAGCGRAAALITLAEHYPDSRFVGIDLCDDAVAFARQSAAGRGLENIRFEARDLGDFDATATFDFITSFDAVHDQKNPQDFIKRMHRALRPGGVYLMQDIGASAALENNRDFPMAAMLYAVSCTHCMPISLGQGGVGLGTMWGRETAEAMLGEAGFASVEGNVLPHDPTNIWFVSRKT